MDDSINITIHLDPSYPPDPFGETDIIALSLVCIYGVFFFLILNAVVFVLSRTWKTIRTIDLPLTFLMSWGSLLHLMCIFVDMSFVPEFTEDVHDFSCVLTVYWGQYVFGLIPVLACLFVRMYTLLMLSVESLRPAGAPYRTTVARLIAFAVFMMPIYGLCLRVTVNDNIAFVEGAAMCTTPVQYKISLVSIMVLYIVAITVISMILGYYDVYPKDSAAVMDIVRVSTIALLVGCVMQFMYMIPHYWGRLTFMCLAFVMHTYAYGRIVLPSLVAYYYTRKMLSTVVWSDPKWESGILLHGDRTSQEKRPGAKKAPQDAIVLHGMISRHGISMHPEFFKTLSNMRIEFFLHCSKEMRDDILEFKDFEWGICTSINPKVYVNVVMLTSFYNALDAVLTERTRTYSANKNINDNSVLGSVQSLVRILQNMYIKKTGQKYMGLDTMVTSRINEGFRGRSLESCDFRVIERLRDSILTFLINENYTTYSARCISHITDLCDFYKKEYEFDCAAQYAEGDNDTNADIDAGVNDLLSILKEGNSEVSSALDIDIGDIELSTDNMYPGGTSEFDDMYEETERVQYSGMDSVLTVDETLSDGSIIYASPWRATVAFVCDTRNAFSRLPANLCSSCKRPPKTESVEEELMQNTQ
jgi:hypothetical protein